jgi:hypothetical protein
VKGSPAMTPRDCHQAPSGRGQSCYRGES